MRCVEYGKENKDTILLLHGGGLSWWNYEEAAESLQKEYHIILPILDGHSGSDRAFTTIEDNAAEIISFIDAQFDGKVFLIGGLSLGGQILLEMLSQRRDICQFAVIESALVIPSKLIHSMIKPAFGSCYGLIRYKWFSKLQFKSLHIRSDLFVRYFEDTCAISREDMIVFLQENSMYSLKEGTKNCTAKIHVFVGGREKRSMKKSAGRIHQAFRGSTLHVLPALHHGEFSVNHGREYAAGIREIVST